MKISLSDLLVLFVSNRLRERTRPLKEISAIIPSSLPPSLALLSSPFAALSPRASSLIATYPPRLDSLPFLSGSETDLFPLSPPPRFPPFHCFSVNPAWEISNTSLFTRHLKSRRISMIRFRLHRSRPARPVHRLAFLAPRTLPAPYPSLLLAA